MSEDVLKVHKMRLLISTDHTWSTEQVAEQARLVLLEVQLEDGPFEGIHVLTDNDTDNDSDTSS